MRLRVVPLAVLLTVVGVAVVLRVTRRETPRSAITEATSAAASSSSAASLVPIPGPGAAPPGAPRMLHGGPAHAHRAAAIGPRTIKQGWRANTGGPVAAQVVASPDGATLYAATLTGSVVAVARADGAIRWSTPLGNRVYSTPYVADDGTLWVGSDAKKLVTLDPSGKIRFQLETTGEVDTAPVPAKDGTVIVAAGREVLSVRRGGDVAWRFAARNKIFTSPAITPSGLVIVGSQDDHVYALRADGSLAWSVDLGGDVDGGAAIADDGTIYVGTDKGEVAHLDGAGKLLWRTPVGGFVRGTLAVARNGDVLAGTYGPVPKIVRLTAEGTLRGSFAIRGTGAKEFGIHGAPLEDAAGVLYFGAQDDAVYAVGDGQLFRFETKADVDAPLSMLDDGSLVVASEDGFVTLLLP